MTDELGLSQQDMDALRSLISKAQAAGGPMTPAPTPSVSSAPVVSLSDVKENLQAVSDRFANGWDRLRITVRVYQRESNSQRHSGYYLEKKTIEEFLEFVHAYYSRYPNTEAHQHITALLNAVFALRDDQSRDRDALILLMDQYALLQEKQIQAAIAAELQRMRAAREREVAQHVLPPPPAAPPAPATGPLDDEVPVPRPPPRVVRAMPVVEVDLDADAPIPDLRTMPTDQEEHEAPRTKKSRGTVTDDEDLDEAEEAYDE